MSVTLHSFSGPPYFHLVQHMITHHLMFGVLPKLINCYHSVVAFYHRARLVFLQSSLVLRMRIYSQLLFLSYVHQHPFYFLPPLL
jgi:hypothetical protein